MKISAFLLLLIPFCLFAQEYAQSDTTRVIALYDFVNEVYETSPDTAMQLIEDAMLLSEENNYLRGVAEGHYFLGRTLTIMGNYQKSLENFYAGLEYYEDLQDLTGQADVYSGVITLLYRDSPGQALEYIKKYLDLAIATNDTARIFDSYGWYGVTYNFNGEADKGMEYNMKCLAVYEDMKKGGMSFTPRRPQRINAALLFIWYGALMNNMGEAYSQRGEYDQALKLFEKSLSVGYKPDQSAATLANISNVYVAKGNLSKARQYAAQALDSAQRQGSPSNIVDATEFYHGILTGLGEYKRAYEVFSLHVQMRDSINVKQVEQAVLEKDLTHEHEKELLALSKDREKSEAINRLIIISVSGGLVVLAVFLFLLYRKTQRIRRSKAALQVEKDRSENLLLNILPADIAAELKENGEAAARDFERVSILFTDFKEFTQISEKLSAAELVAEINYCFKGFDEITEKYGIEKIKTIGDAYMATGGLPIPTNDSARNTVLAAIEMQRFISHRKSENNAQSKLAFEMRLGIHTGPVVAGIVGVKKFQYDVWGYTVNTASRMESAGEVGKVNISHYTYELIKDDTNFTFNKREKIEVKGKGEMDMYFVTPMES